MNKHLKLFCNPTKSVFSDLHLIITSTVMSISFEEACGNGDEMKARQLFYCDKSVLNRREEDTGGYTGLMNAFYGKHYSICRWLLSLPDIDVNLKDYVDGATALHAATSRNAPLDLVISLAKLASMETIDLKMFDGPAEISVTALEMAVDVANEEQHPSNAIYLSWLGAQCRDENIRVSNVTLQTWLDAGRQQDAPMWAVAAKDLKALDQLVKMEGITVDRDILLNLADLFGYQEIKAFLEENSNLKIYSKQVFCDFEITLKEKSFPCHKIFLAKHSEPIQALIEEKARQNLPMKTEVENCPKPPLLLLRPLGAGAPGILARYQ